MREINNISDVMYYFNHIETFKMNENVLHIQDHCLVKDFLDPHFISALK